MSKSNNLQAQEKNNPYISKQNDSYTLEQQQYIEYTKKTDTKLLASAGSGKTFTIIHKMDYLLKNDIYKSDEILMMTFSRFTRDDFLNKIKKYNIENINEQNIRTIDGFAKSLIDPDNEIDVSLLSYKFLQYLQTTSNEDIQKNDKLSCMKLLFVDEAQDLNEIQFEIITLLKEKNNTLINLIGDPNQNIYQFRNSSDKFLTSFNAKTFYLTQNFRSHDSIINFSKHLRPIQDMNIQGHLGKNDCEPMIIFHENESELEQQLVDFLTNAKASNIDLSDIAILSPTRGKMKGYGRSHGLCLISNLLYKNKFKFKQFYEEYAGEFNSNVAYGPQKGHVNLLTYMGSKGLEWKYVILIDADMCLINKRQFDETKHKNDQYLLYVACSRAIDNMVIFSKYRIYNADFVFQLNPWFEQVPKQYFVIDPRFAKFLQYPKIKHYDMGNNEKKIIKILDKIDEKTLDELATICKYGSINNENNKKSEKTITNIYNDFSQTITPNVFLSKYIKNLFFAYYNMAHGLDKKKYIDIENIISSKHIVTDVPSTVSDWFYINREHLTWESYDQTKDKLDKIIVDTIEKKFNRGNELAKHTIVTDNYFKSFIFSMKDSLTMTYEKYLKTTSTVNIRKHLFYIIVVIYALETQHYYHVLNKGKRFKHLLESCAELFDNIKEFVYESEMDIIKTNVSANIGHFVGEIDFVENKNDKYEIWEIKSTFDIGLKNILQVLMYNIMYHNYNGMNDDINIVNIENVNNANMDVVEISINFLNLLKGDIVRIDITLSSEELNKIKAIVLGVK